jgi:alkyl hydroperoxide reductase subunit AhpF
MRGEQVKTKLKCPHCPRVFEGDAASVFGGGRLKANLANHMKAHHPEHFWPTKAARAQQMLKQEEEKLIEKPSLSVNQGAKPALVKRPYVKQSKPESSVCYCPKCGCNIRAVQVAMGL